MLTAEQREQRRKYLGASDAAAALGYSPWETASDVWLAKTGRIEDGEETDAMRTGSLLEVPLLAWCRDRIGQAIASDIMRVHPSDLLCANLDGLTQNNEIVEAKTAGSADGWGEEMTDEIPEHYLIQVAHQFAVFHESAIAWVPVLIPGFRHFDFRLYRVERNDRLVKSVEAKGIEFMERFVRTDTPPDNFQPSMEALKLMRREAGKVVAIDDGLIEAWITAQAEAKEAEKRADDAKAAVLAAMGDADGATFSGGTLTYFEQTARRIDTEKLKTLHPDVAAECIKESSFRVLRRKAAKKERIGG